MPKVSQERPERPSPVKADRRVRVKTEPQDEVPALRLSAEQNIKDEPQVLDMELRPRDLRQVSDLTTPRRSKERSNHQTGDPN